MEEKKTHRLVATPQMSVRFLADYMAASDQVRRTVLRSCKYRPIARIVQHDEAKFAVTKYFINGGEGPEVLNAEAAYIRNKLVDDDFDKDCNDINADYIERFAQVAENVQLPKGAEWEKVVQFKAQPINGVRVSFAPSLLVRRVARSNKVKIGALMLRYRKGSKLSSEVAAYQSAAIHGMMSLYEAPEDTNVDLPLCLTLDAQSGTLHPAPTNSVSRFNNTKAACATIAEAWDNLQPPKGAIL